MTTSPFLFLLLFILYVLWFGFVLFWFFLDLVKRRIRPHNSCIARRPGTYNRRFITNLNHLHRNVMRLYCWEVLRQFGCRINRSADSGRLMKKD